MFLVDTNVWLELLLEQQKAHEVRQFLEGRDSGELAITEFSLYSIGIILTRLKKDDLFADFVSDTVEGSGVLLVRLDGTGLKELLVVQRRFGLDFDDAYQYVAPGRNTMTLLSFDSDFDRTERGRKTPAEVVG